MKSRKILMIACVGAIVFQGLTLLLWLANWARLATPSALEEAHRYTEEEMRTIALVLHAHLENGGTLCVVKVQNGFRVPRDSILELIDVMDLRYPWGGSFLDSDDLVDAWGKPYHVLIMPTSGKPVQVQEEDGSQLFKIGPAKLVIWSSGPDGHNEDQDRKRWGFNEVPLSDPALCTIRDDKE